MNAARTGTGFTALMGASQKDHLEVVRELCERGASVNAAMTNSGRTALMWASCLGCVDTCNFLLSHGSNKSALDLQGRSAYDLVQEGKSYSILRELLTLRRRSSRLKG